MARRGCVSRTARRRRQRRRGRESRPRIAAEAAAAAVVVAGSLEQVDAPGCGVIFQLGADSDPLDQTRFNISHLWCDF